MSVLSELEKQYGADLVRLQAVCTAELLHHKYADTDQSIDRFNGFCYALTQAMYVLHPELIPHYIKYPDGSHWFPVHAPTGMVYDTVADRPSRRQSVCDPEDYRRGRPLGYRNRLPEKRARLMLQKAGFTIPDFTPQPPRTKIVIAI